MTRTSNFRRVLCLLLTLLLVFTTALRPITAQASVTGAAVGAAVFVSPPVAIAGILAIIGIGVAVKNYSAIQDWVQDAIRHFFIDTDDGQAVPAYKYGNQLYVDEDIIETAVDSYSDFCSAMYSDVWDMGQKYQYMYTVKTADPTRYDVIWSDGDCFTEIDDESREWLFVKAPCLWYSYFDGRAHVSEYLDGAGISHPDYRGVHYNETSIANVTKTAMGSVENPFQQYAPGITVTTDDNTKTAARPILDATTTEYVSTGTQVKVETGTNAGTDTETVPGTGTADVSGILAWLQAIWEAIKALASDIVSPISDSLSSIFEQIKTSTTAINSNLIARVSALAYNVDSAKTAVTDAISTGITSVTSWLSDIWDAIKGLATDITTPITKLLTNIGSLIGNLGVVLQGQILPAISAVKTGVASLVDFFTGTATVASPTEALHFSALFDLFPFNIPYGIYQAISFWEASAAPPVITIPLPTVSGGSVDLYEYEIDFSEIPGMDTIAAVIRAGELILFCIGLLMITRKVTKW